METLSDITLIQALMVAIFAGIAGIDLFNVLTHIHRPIIAGPIVGILMGDPQAGLIAGAAFEFMFMGLVPLAGAQPPSLSRPRQAQMQPVVLPCPSPSSCKSASPSSSLPSRR